MDLMQEMLKLIKMWLTSMKKIATYIQESFLPDSDYKGGSPSFLWWF